MAGDVVITGLDIEGTVRTDTIALNNSSSVSGVVAFSSITSVLYPIKTNSSGDTVSLGINLKIGMPHAILYIDQLVANIFDTTTDTSGAITPSTSAHTTLYTINGTPNGTKKLTLSYWL